STSREHDHPNAHNRTGYQAGADVRVLFALGSQPPPVSVVASMPGVISTSQPYRSAGRPGKLEVDTTVLGIDGSGVWNAAWRGGALAPGRLDAQTGLLGAGDLDGIALPAEPRELSLWVYSTGLDGRVSAQVTDASGAVLTARLG